MLLASLKRLEATIEAETEALRGRHPIDYEALNRSKGQSLLELTRLARGLSLDPADPHVGITLARVRDKLALNQEVVAMHLRAVEEIGDTLNLAMRHLDSDGTYSARLGR